VGLFPGIQTFSFPQFLQRSVYCRSDFDVAILDDAQLQKFFPATNEFHLSGKNENDRQVLSPDGTNQGILKGEVHCTVDLLFDWFGISCRTTYNFCFYLQNRLMQTSQTGGQWYSVLHHIVFPGLGYLGVCDTNRIGSVCVSSPKASTHLLPSH